MSNLEPHMDWAKVAAELGWDGSLRDLYVFETSECDWNTFLSSLSSWPYEASFLVDGEPSALPDTAAAAFMIGERAAPLLRVKVSGITVCSHFFTPDEMEFDIDPRQVSEPAGLSALSEFICRLGHLLERPIVLTHENQPDQVIARYLPGTGEFVYPSPDEDSNASYRGAAAD